MRIEPIAQERAQDGGAVLARRCGSQILHRESGGGVALPMEEIRGFSPPPHAGEAAAGARLLNRRVGKDLVTGRIRHAAFEERSHGATNVERRELPAPDRGVVVDVLGQQLAAHRPQARLGAGEQHRIAAAEPFSRIVRDAGRDEVVVVVDLQDVRLRGRRREQLLP